MAILRVNKLGTHNNTAAGQSSLTMTVTASTTAHNRIIVVVFWGAQNVTASVTDSQGNNYVQDATGAAPSSGGWGRVFSARADNVLTNAVDTITVTWTGGTVNDTMMAAYEYSGLANFSPLDVTVIGSGNTHTSASGNLVTTKANELIFGLTGWATSSAASLPTYTELDQIHGSTHSLETQENIVAATGTYNVGLTMSGTPGWVAMAAGYADTANSAANQPSNSTAPAITGSGMLGMQLTCSQGAWGNMPTAYAYQWKRAGVNITGATAAHYLVASADLGQALSCAVTASNKYGSTAATSSNTVTPAIKSVATGLGI